MLMILVRNATLDENHRISATSEAAKCKHPFFAVVIASIACSDGTRPVELEDQVEADSVLAHVHGLLPVIPFVRTRRQLLYVQ
jgi:hypothetical protein